VEGRERVEGREGKGRGKTKAGEGREGKERTLVGPHQHF